MKVKALVTSGVNVSTVTAKSGKNAGKEFTFRRLSIIDLEAQRQEVLELDVHENDVQAANVLQGKTVLLDVFYFSGSHRFGGLVTQHQQQKTA
jgi:hypothetical protein